MSNKLVEKVELALVECQRQSTRRKAKAMLAVVADWLDSDAPLLGAGDAIRQQIGEPTHG